MTREDYEFVCHTCTVREIVHGLERAQERFSQHAEDGCMVLIRSFDASREDGEPVRTDLTDADRERP